MQCVPPSKLALSRPQSQGNLEFPNPMSGRYSRMACVEKPDPVVALPAIYQWPELAEEGGFLGYGPRLVQLYRETMARQLVKLLRGAKPADMPGEQPTKFEFVINMKTAKALGLPVSPSMQLLAHEVIE